MRNNDDHDFVEKLSDPTMALAVGADIVWFAKDGHRGKAEGLSHKYRANKDEETAK